MKFFMKGLLFLSRLAFICNVLFFICWLLQRTHNFIDNRDIEGTVIILGWIIAPFLNLLVNLRLLFLLKRSKQLPLPVWLIMVNAVFLLAEILIQFIFPV